MITVVMTDLFIRDYLEYKWEALWTASAHGAEPPAHYLANPALGAPRDAVCVTAMPSRERTPVAPAVYHAHQQFKIRLSHQDRYACDFMIENVLAGVGENAIVYSWGFEDGTLPTNVWTYPSTATIAVQSTVKKTGTYAVKMTSSSVYTYFYQHPYSGPSLIRDAIPPGIVRRHSAEFRLSGNPSGDKWVGIFELTEYPHAMANYVMFKSDGHLYGYNVGGAVDLGAFSTDTFYKIETRYNDNLTADYYVGGVAKSTANAFYAATRLPDSFTHIMHESITPAIDVYVDDVQVYLECPLDKTPQFDVHYQGRDPVTLDHCWDVIMTVDCIET